MMTKVLNITTLFFIGAFTMVGFAQPMLKTTPHYACVQLKENKLHFPKGDAAFVSFYGKLDSLLLFGEGNVNIFHIGGSHVQADFFSHRIRTNLVSIQPNLQANRGLVYPYSLNKPNNTRNYYATTEGSWVAEINSKQPYTLPMGVMGVAAQTSDSLAKINLKLNRPNADVTWSFNRLRLLGSSNTDSVLPFIAFNQDSIWPQYEPTYNSYLFELPESTDSVTIQLRIPDRAGSFILNGIVPEYSKNGINYYSAGVNGASVSSWLRCQNFEQELQLCKPDIVVLAIGINDAYVPYGKFNVEQFKNNYRQLLAQFRRVSPHCQFIFITNNDNYRRTSRRNTAPNKNSVLAQKAFYELAEEYSGAVWDLYKLMGGLGSSNEWRRYQLMAADRLHFTQRGYELLGDLFYNALISHYMNYQPN